MLLIGSRAIKHWFPDFPREPKDTDYAVLETPKCTPSEEMVGKVEYLINPVIGVMKGVALPDVLYTLKMSHLFWDVNWEKHLWDLHFLKKKGCGLNRPLFDKLYHYFNELHGKNKRSDLKMTASDFFNNALTFPIEHDELHKILITHPYFEGQLQPTYTKILKEGEEVDVCMNKFKNLTEKEKFNIVFEEVACMGVERFPRNMYYKRVHDRMLKKFIISHCKIDEAIWIIENYPKLVCEIPFDFCKFIHEKVDTLTEV